MHTSYSGPKGLIVTFDLPTALHVCSLVPRSHSQRRAPGSEQDLYAELEFYNDVRYLELSGVRDLEQRKFHNVRYYNGEPFC